MEVNQSVNADVVAGLAREVDALRRAVRGLSALPGRVEEVAATVARALEDLSASGRRPQPVRPVSWIAGDGPADCRDEVDVVEAVARFAELADWVGQVYLRYPAARDLSDCWLWHPDVVEELAWLHQAWRAAYHPETGSVGAVADWHDRHRPGVVARIRVGVHCTLQKHADPDRPTGAVDAPSTSSVDAITQWWTTARDQQPPLPSQRDRDVSAARLHAGARYR